jgi:hypothetical protein
MAAGTVGYNLAHIQIGLVATTPTYIDVPYAISLDPSVDQPSEKLKADAGSQVTAFGAMEGGGSIEWGLITPAVLAMMTGGTASTSGTAGTVIDRVEVKSNVQPPSLIVVGWLPNVDGKQTSAGIRLTLPNAKLTVPAGAMGQETYANRTADLSYDGDANNTIQIWEFPVTAPVFTGGVIPANLTAPA